MTVTAVHFGTTSVPFTVVNATTITTAAPAGLTGAQNVRVTTAHGQSPISAAFTYTAALGIPVINSALTIGAIEGTAFSYQIAATNSPTSFNATGLPGWLSVNTGNGQITGTPPVGSAGPLNITITATNATGPSAPATLVLTVSAPGPFDNSTPVPHVSQPFPPGTVTGQTLADNSSVVMSIWFTEYSMWLGVDRHNVRPHPAQNAAVAIPPGNGVMALFEEPYPTGGVPEGALMCDMWDLRLNVFIGGVWYRVT